MDCDRVRVRVVVVLNSAKFLPLFIMPRNCRDETTLAYRHKRFVTFSPQHKNRFSVRLTDDVNTAAVKDLIARVDLSKASALRS